METIQYHNLFEEIGISAEKTASRLEEILMFGQRECLME